MEPIALSNLEISSEENTISRQSGLMTRAASITTRCSLVSGSLCLVFACETVYLRSGRILYRNECNAARRIIRSNPQRPREPWRILPGDATRSLLRQRASEQRVLKSKVTPWRLGSRWSAYLMPHVSLVEPAATELHQQSASTNLLRDSFQWSCTLWQENIVAVYRRLSPFSSSANIAVILASTFA